MGTVKSCWKEKEKREGGKFGKFRWGSLASLDSTVSELSRYETVILVRMSALGV